MIGGICLYEQCISSEREHPARATVTKRRAEQPRWWLQPFLLLALEQWQSHGYELIRRMSAFGFETLDRGSVYRTLRQLEKDGLVTSGWDTSHDGPARRLYTLTDAGRLYLEACAASLRGYQMMLNQFFSLYPSPSAPADTPRGRARTRAVVERRGPGARRSGTSLGQNAAEGHRHGRPGMTEGGGASWATGEAYAKLMEGWNQAFREAAGKAGFAESSQKFLNAFVEQQAVRGRRESSGPRR